MLQGVTQHLLYNHNYSVEGGELVEAFILPGYKWSTSDEVSLGVLQARMVSILMCFLTFLLSHQQKDV